MIRSVLLALAALAASACSYGSAVDMAPMSARSASAIFASGDYCEAKGAKADGPFTVGSSKDCLRITWNRATRSYTMVDDDAKDKINTAIAPLGGDLYLAQIEDNDGDHGDAPDKYQIQLFITRGNAFLVLPMLEDKPLAELARKHPELTFGKKSPKPTKLGSHEDEEDPGGVYIAAGRPEDIKAFLRDVAREAVRTAKADDDKKDDISVGVRDGLGKRDHPASRTQAADIQAILKSFDALGK